MARKLVLRPPEDRAQHLREAETEEDLLDWLKFSYLPRLHNLEPRIQVEITQVERIPEPTGNYFVVKYSFPVAGVLRGFLSIYQARFWLEEIELTETHTLPVSLPSARLPSASLGTGRASGESPSGESNPEPLEGFEIISGEPRGGA